MKTLLKLCICIQIVIFVFVGKLNAQVDSNNITHLSSIMVDIESPVRLAIDNSGNIYATDSYKDNIVVFDASGNLLDVITSVKSPLSVAINDAKQLFVGDGKSGDIIKIGTNGDTSVFYSGCLMPSSMTFGTDSLLYVVDTKRKNVIALDISANVVKTFGEGTLILPTSIVYDDRNSRILVGEHGGVGTGFSSICKVWIFDLQGNLIGSFGSNGNADGQFYRIQGMAIGRCGNIYVCDPFQARISIFDENGNFITKFGKFGNMPNEINMPLDIAIDSNKQIIVSSLNKGTLEIYAISDTLPSSNITNSDATICIGSQTDILIDFTGTAPWTFTYAIDGVDQAPVTTSVTPYTLTVSNGGLYEVSSLFDANYTGSCFSGSARVKVISELPGSNISSADTAVCSGQSTNIVIGFTGTSPWNFTYTVDGINPTTIRTANNPYVLNTAIDGLYEVIAVSDAGCIGTIFTGTTDVVVNSLPTSSFTNGNSTVQACEGASTDLSIDFTGTAPWNFTYTIDGTPTMVNTNSTPYTIAATKQGTYLVTQLSDATCSGTNLSGSANVIINSVPTVGLSTRDDFMCTGASSELRTSFTGQSPWTISYTTNGANPITITGIFANPFDISVLQAGDYEIIALSDANCTGTNFPTKVVIAESPLPMVFLGEDINICEGETITLDAGAFASYLWNDGSTNQTLITSAPGNYTVDVTDDKGCKNSDEIFVTLHQLPFSDFTFSSEGREVSFVNNSLSSNSYLWEFGDGQTSTDINPVHIYESSGEYLTNLMASNEFCGEDIYIANVSIAVLSFGNADSWIWTKIYPNPTKGKLTIEINNSVQSDFNLEIISATGNCIFSKTYQTRNTIEKLDLSSFSSGVYTLRMTTKDLIKTKKIILY